MGRVCSVGFSYANEGIFFRPPPNKHVAIIKHSLQWSLCSAADIDGEKIGCSHVPV